jgi:fatty acid desaturase
MVEFVSGGPGRSRGESMSRSMQSYEPYRSTLLSRDDLRELQQLRPGRAIRDTVLTWLCILAAFALVAAFPRWYVVLAVIPFIGTRYYALLIIGHDGLHRRLFDSPKRSDLWNDLLIIGPIGAVTHLNRRNHMRHHAQLSTEIDPDRYKYIGANKRSRIAFLLVLTGLPYVFRALRNVFAPSPAAPKDQAANSRARYGARDLAIIAGWQLVLIGGLTYFIGWWAYPVLWLLPVYAFAFVADLVRVFCEHSMMADDASADRTIRLVSFTSNVFERQFFAPNNMNCHIAHHLWPGIPYYNLPEAERRIRRAIAAQPAVALTWRSSYFGYLIDYARWIGRDVPALDEGVQVQ